MASKLNNAEFTIADLEFESDSDDDVGFCGSVNMFAEIFTNVQQQLHKKSDLTKPPVKSKHHKHVSKKKKSNASSASSRTRSRTSKRTGIEEIILERPDDENGISSSTRELCAELKELEEDLLRNSAKKPRKPVKSTKAMNVSEDIIVLDDDEDEAILPVIGNIRIRWKNEILKFKMNMATLVCELRGLLSDKVSVRADDIIIFVSDFEDLDDTKTLADAGVSCGDILDASRRISTSALDSAKTLSNDPSYIRIKCQGQIKGGTIFLQIRRTTALKQLRKDYAEKFGLNPLDLVLRFDGDIVNLNDTPDSLDFDEDECIDVCF